MILPFFMIALGALGIIGGGVCLAYGLPYLVLEQGFTYAIIGSVLMTGGVLLIALGLLLRELRAMAGRIGGFSAQDAAAAIAAGAVAAGSAVAAGIVAGQAQPDDPKHIGKDDSQGELPLDAAPDPAQETSQEPSQLPSPSPASAGMATADAPEPDIAVPPDAAMPDAAMPSEPALDAESILPPPLKLPQAPAWPPAASWTNLDELPAPRRDIDEPAPDRQDAECEASPAAPAAPMPPAPSDDEDPFERLRRSLMLGEKPVRADALAAGMTPGARGETLEPPGLPPEIDALPSPALPDEAAEDAAIAELATPEPEDHAEAAIAEAAHAEHEIGEDSAQESRWRPGEDAEGQPERGEADMAGPSTAAAPEPDAPEAQTPPAPEIPAVSEEGIVSVRRIGDSTYTMYADGSVKAETPVAVLHFATVAELKAHLANPLR